MTAKSSFRKQENSSDSRRANKLRSAVLFSGGKDSALALAYALDMSAVKCLIIIQSLNPDSYMFHTPNIKWAKLQAEAAGIPCIIKKTQGVKEDELKDLKSAIMDAKKRFKVQAIVTGAIESVYQASRVQTITNDLNMECFNPLWQRDQTSILEELVSKKFDVIISSIAAEGLGKQWLGRHIDADAIAELKLLNKKFGMNIAFEGGEAESFVLWAPYFSKRIIIKDSGKVMTGECSGYYDMREVELA